MKRREMFCWNSGALAALPVIFVLCTTVRAQTVPVPPRAAIESLDGRDLYQFYCASCHGRDGKGDGPVASVLTVRPSDLTTISLRYGGRFPNLRLEAVIAGEGGVSGASHGPREMPVWGPIFRSLDPLDPNDTRTRIRIRNLVAYIASLQIK